LVIFFTGDGGRSSFDKKMIVFWGEDEKKFKKVKSCYLTSFFPFSLTFIITGL
jgi:hypothetical protein